MNTRTRQIGGMYNTLFLLLCIGGSALLTLTIAPVYMNEGKVAKIVGQTAASPQYYNQNIASIRSTLAKRWDVDAVKEVDYKEVKLVQSKNGGKALAYKYEVRKHIFSNIDLVLTFDKSYPMARGG